MQLLCKQHVICIDIYVSIKLFTYPINVFKTNAVITILPPKSRTWISYIKIKVFLYMFDYCNLNLHGIQTHDP